ncbi:hypothetical protein HF086_016902 [Spodoptera exigua]|uniref:Uncharacterized protein n=1 Tax=Spodoptera exigua TaxID=7107 RepID=A0A922SDC3_SPOEX|nr:hypothetical protein HF086_016902 [Spodoptera exigua]
MGTNPYSGAKFVKRKIGSTKRHTHSFTLPSDLQYTPEKPTCATYARRPGRCGRSQAPGSSSQSPNTYCLIEGLQDGIWTQSSRGLYRYVK